MKFCREVVDFRADLDLLPVKEERREGRMLAIRDGALDEESECGSECSEEEDLWEFVRECEGKNPMDVVFEVVRFLGDAADREEICEVAGLAGVGWDLAEGLVEEWKSVGVFRELESGYVVVCCEVGPWSGRRRRGDLEPD